MRHPLPPVLHHTPILWKKNASDPKLKVVLEKKNVFEKIPLLLFLLVTLLANCLTVCAILWAVLSGSNDFARTLNPFQGQFPVCPTLCFAQNQGLDWNPIFVKLGRVGERQGGEEDSHWFIAVLIWGLFTMWHVLPRPPYLIRSSVYRFRYICRISQMWGRRLTLMDCGHPADLAPGVGFEASKLPPIRETIGDPSVSRSIPPYIDAHTPFSSRTCIIVCNVISAPLTICGFNHFPW